MGMDGNGVPKKVGFWLPFRESMASVTYDAPGALVREVREGFLSALRKNSDVEMVEVEDFRKGLLCDGEAFIEGLPEGRLDAFVWFGEIGRDFRREYNLELLKAIGRHATVINDPNGYEVAMDKYLTGSFLARHDIPVPKFMLVSPEKADAASIRMSGWKGNILLKPRFGSYGIGIMKLDRPADVIDALDYSPAGNHYVEQLIPNDPAGWIGINIIGGQHAYSYRKGPESFQDGWKVMDRTRAGGKMVLAKPTAQQLSIAKRIAGLLGMAWVGVDIITDSSGNPYVVDVNAFPGLYPEMFAEAGIDGPKMMADAVLSRIRV